MLGYLGLIPKNAPIVQRLILCLAASNIGMRQLGIIARGGLTVHSINPGGIIMENSEVKLQCPKCSSEDLTKSRKPNGVPDLWFCNECGWCGDTWSMRRLNAIKEHELHPLVIVEIDQSRLDPKLLAALRTETELGNLRNPALPHVIRFIGEVKAETTEPPKPDENLPTLPTSHDPGLQRIRREKEKAVLDQFEKFNGETALPANAEGEITFSKEPSAQLAETKEELSASAKRRRRQ